MWRRVDFGGRLVGRAAELAAVLAGLRGTRPTGVLVAGPPGVGKSRLAQEASAALAGPTAGRPGPRLLTVRTTGTGSRLPLSGLLGVLKGLPTPGDHPTRWALDALRELAAGAPTLLFVDDIQLLDEASAIVVHQLVADRTVHILATLRTGDVLPDAVTALWKDLGVARLDLAELVDDDIGKLVTATLGGPVEGQTMRRLREAAAGNPLFLRELLLSMSDGKLLDHTGGLWRLNGPMRITPQLTELLDARLAATDVAQRDGLELLALGEPLPLPVAVELAGAPVLEELERRGLVTLHGEGPEHTIRLSHPLYGELLRGRAPELARRRHSRRLADALEGAGAALGDDGMRAAMWRLDGGGQANAPLMLAAAEHAALVRQHELAARLAASAHVAGGGVYAALTAAQALFQSGRLDDALVACERLRTEVADDTQRAMLAVQHASILAHGADDVHGGLAVLDRTRVTDPRCRERLRIARLYLRAYQLDCSVMAEASVAFATAEAVDSRLAAAGALGGAYMLAGRLAESARTVELATPLAAEHTGAGRLHADSMRSAGGWMRAHEPDPAGALADARAAYAASLHPPDRPAQALAAFTIAQIALLLGRPAAASRWAIEAGLVADQFQLRPVVRWAAGVRAQAAGQLGGGPELADAGRELAARPAGPRGVLLFDMDVARGWAWHAAARGDGQLVREVLVAEVDRCGDRGAVAMVVLGALDLVRLGHPAAALALLDRHPCGPGWTLGELTVRYAGAAAGNDAPALLQIAGEFAEHRMALHAAEAARTAARAWCGTDPHAAARALLVADTALAACAAGQAPSLWPARTGDGLTARETEFVRLAAAGEPSRGIAARLHLSERTVENHLHRAYGKLGMSGRNEVRQLLDAPVRAFLEHGAEGSEWCAGAG